MFINDYKIISYCIVFDSILSLSYLIFHVPAQPTDHQQSQVCIVSFHIYHVVSDLSYCYSDIIPHLWLLFDPRAQQHPKTAPCVVQKVGSGSEKVAGCPNLLTAKLDLKHELFCLRIERSQAWKGVYTRLWTFREMLGDTDRVSLSVAAAARRFLLSSSLLMVRHQLTTRFLVAGRDLPWMSTEIPWEGVFSLKLSESNQVKVSQGPRKIMENPLPAVLFDQLFDPLFSEGALLGVMFFGGTDSGSPPRGIFKAVPAWRRPSDEVRCWNQLKPTAMIPIH